MCEACRVRCSKTGLTAGGERKRVSLAEALTTDASIYCWDNATRGLDASTALSYTRICRSLCDEQGKINVISLYQAGNGIYDLFDKVTVIAAGRVIYYGPRALARRYFEDLGFEHLEGANTADYLTAVTALAERQVKQGFQGMVPNTAAEFAEAYRKSNIARTMLRELNDHLANKDTLRHATEMTIDTARSRKNKGALQSSPQITGFAAQLKATIIRDFQQRWGDQWWVVSRFR
jgi:ATP-binding cassette subfamily G (WHITE) protein 2 (SNQ2)